MDFNSSVSIELPQNQGIVTNYYFINRTQSYCEKHLISTNWNMSLINENILWSKTILTQQLPFSFSMFPIWTYICTSDPCESGPHLGFSNVIALLDKLVKVKGGDNTETVQEDLDFVCCSKKTLKHHFELEKSTSCYFHNFMLIVFRIKKILLTVFLNKDLNSARW